MLLGKKFPVSLRTLWFVVADLLRGNIKKINSYHELEQCFFLLCKKRIFPEHWKKNWIKPLFLMLLYISVARERGFGFYLFAFKQMIPYYFVAGHFNYARCGLCTGCATFIPWENFQKTHLNHWWKENMSRVIREEYGILFGMTWWLE